MRGRFITFEGGEGCGKSTQVKRLAEALEASGREVVVTREPGGTRLAELVRSLLKDEREDPPCDRSELLLFLAARAQLVRNVIRPALAAGKWVVCDRFSDSTFAYQGYGRGLPLDELRLMNGFACDGLTPDLTLLLDVRPEVARARMRRREEATNTSADRIEQAGDSFHARTENGFEQLYREEPDRFLTVNADQKPETVTEEAFQKLFERMTGEGVL